MTTVGKQSKSVWRPIHLPPADARTVTQDSRVDITNPNYARWWSKKYNLSRREEITHYAFAAVAELYRYWIMACLVTSSSPVPLKTRRVEQRSTLNLLRAQMSSHWCGVVVRRVEVPAQVSSTSLDHGSKSRGPSPKALV
ncbi:uncharacterized protein TNCV_470021 [Trichonephila clavipes]|nr:uncharacterized protein TNCV_470021 [Trichonephila clavipes]